MWRPSSIRTTLLLIISTLVLLIAVLAVHEAYSEWNRLHRIESLKHATVLGDRLFDASAKISIERDIGFSLLHAADPQTLDELRGRLAAARQDVDAAMSVIADLGNYNFPGLADQARETQSRFEQLKALRGEIDRAIAASGRKADSDLSQRWFSVTTALILQTQDLWIDFIRHFSDVDSYASLHMRFKYMLGVIMEYSGRQRALIGQLLAENADPTPEEQANLLTWQGAVDIAWQLSDSLADQSGLNPAIAPYLNDARSHYVTVHDMVKDMFYVPGARHGTSYPIDVGFWLDLATQTTDSLYALKDEALRQTRDYVDLLEMRAQRALAFYSLVLVFALILCFTSLRIVAYRVIEPIDAMVEALIAATEGREAPAKLPAIRRQDEIGKLARVLQAFREKAEEIRKTGVALAESEQKLYQAQKMEAIGNLTGGMAHDFNNLLGIIIGNLDLLQEKLGTQMDASSLAQNALEAALRGADLTRRLLAFARQQPLQPQRTDINKLVEGITKLLKRTLGEDIEIVLDLAPDIWPVYVDPVQLESAVANLATNARDAMPRGGKLIIATVNSHLDEDYATLYPEMAPGDYAMIAVSDTGTGMPPEVAARIFEPFFTTKERGKGTGLGLAMVFGFMKQSRGHINVYSEPGAGTTFRLYLPRAAGAADAETAAPQTPQAAGGHETILAVEDNDDMRRLVVQQLTQLGYTVLEANGAAAALELLSGGAQVDLLFTDVVMPGKMNGIELARLAMQKWPSLKVVLTSGFPETKLNRTEDSPLGLRLLSKPYRKADLARVLRETLGGGA